MTFCPVFIVFSLPFQQLIKGIREIFSDLSKSYTKFEFIEEDYLEITEVDFQSSYFLQRTQFKNSYRFQYVENVVLLTNDDQSRTHTRIVQNF